MSMAIPGNGWLRDPAAAPEFAVSPLVLYRDIAGQSPDYLFLGDSLTARLPLTPSTVLTANGGALVNQAFPAAGLEGEPNESPLMVAAYRYANANGVYHAASNPSILDIDGTVSTSFSLCFRTVSDAFPANAGTIFGKRVVGGSEVGYELSLNVAGSLTLTWKDTALVQGSLGFSVYNSSAGQRRYADGRWHTIHIEFDVEAGQIRMGTEHVPQMAAAWAGSSLTTATTFRLGGVRAFAAGPIQIAYLAASRGPIKKSSDAAETALALSLETHLVAQFGHRNEPIT